MMVEGGTFKSGRSAPAATGHFHIMITLALYMFSLKPLRGSCPNQRLVKVRDTARRCVEPLLPRSSKHSHLAENQQASGREKRPKRSFTFYISTPLLVDTCALPETVVIRGRPCL